MVVANIEVINHSTTSISATAATATKEATATTLATDTIETKSQKLLRMFLRLRM